MSETAFQAWVREHYNPFIEAYQSYLDSLSTASRPGDGGPVVVPPPPPPPPGG